MKQLINNGRMKFPSCNGPTNAGRHYPAAPSLITPGGGSGIMLEGPGKFLNSKRGEKNSAKTRKTRPGVFDGERGETAEVRKSRRRTA